MKIISHRGNIRGSIPEKENRPSYIDCAIGSGHEVEIDVRYSNGSLWLGHDEPQYKIDHVWIEERKKYLWIHCKNIESLELLSSMHQLNVFWHENDAYTLTSKGFIWTYPHRKVCEKSIIVCNNSKYAKYQNCFGVCSDYLS